MKADIATRLLKAVGFPDFQIRKIVGNSTDVTDTMIATMVEIKMGKGAPPE